MLKCCKPRLVPLVQTKATLAANPNYISSKPSSPHQEEHKGFQVVPAEHRVLLGLNPALEKGSQGKTEPHGLWKNRLFLAVIWAVRNGCFPHHPVNQTPSGVSFNHLHVYQNKPPKQTVEFVSSAHTELTSASFCIKSYSIWRSNSEPSGLSLAIRCCAHYTCYKEKG